jgi:hypothetical protein
MFRELKALGFLSSVFESSPEGGVKQLSAFSCGYTSIIVMLHNYLIISPVNVEPAPQMRQKMTNPCIQGMVKSGFKLSIPVNKRSKAC